MKIYVSDDYKDMSRKAANIVSAHVILNPSCVLGLAPGSTPIGMYKQLIDWYNKGDLRRYAGEAAGREVRHSHFLYQNDKGCKSLLQR